MNIDKIQIAFWSAMMLSLIFITIGVSGYAGVFPALIVLGCLLALFVIIIGANII